MISPVGSVALIFPEFNNVFARPNPRPLPIWEGAIAAKTVTYDFARLMDGATEVKCSEFGEAIVKWMDETPVLKVAGKKKVSPKKKAKR